jgi:hypothetical protein
MRRLWVLVPVLAIAALGLSVLGRSTLGTAAQDASSDSAAHPVVGAWRLFDTAVPEDPPSIVTFHADGTFFELTIDGSINVGAWEATGERSFAGTFIQQFGSEEEGAFTVTICAAGEVDASGDAFTATYTLELTLPDGTKTGEHGPGFAEATRIAVEPMGTPVGTIEDLFAQFEEDAPEGTPAP